MSIKKDGADVLCYRSQLAREFAAEDARFADVAHGSVRSIGAKAIELGPTAICARRSLALRPMDGCCVCERVTAVGQPFWRRECRWHALNWPDSNARRAARGGDAGRFDFAY
jgi:hypothetical protein